MFAFILGFSSFWFYFWLETTFFPLSASCLLLSVSMLELTRQDVSVWLSQSASYPPETLSWDLCVSASLSLWAQFTYSLRIVRSFVVFSQFNCPNLNYLNSFLFSDTIIPNGNFCLLFSVIDLDEILNRTSFCLLHRWLEGVKVFSFTVPFPPFLEPLSCQPLHNTSCCTEVLVKLVFSHSLCAH